MDPITAAALRRPFPPEQVGKLIPKAGSSRPVLDYVGHAAVTDRLLEVDPAWSWEPMGCEPSGIPALDAKGNLWINLTVAGVTRPGVGDSENGKGAKELIGDAIRNAAMRFGIALDLWSKEDLTLQRIVTDEEWLNTTRLLIDAATTREELDKVGQRIAGAVNIDAVNPQDRRELSEQWRERRDLLAAGVSS
jgi:hypothetical protein